MANGNGNSIGVPPFRMPGLAFGGGFVLSNTTILVGAAAALGVGYLLMQLNQSNTLQKAAILEAKEMSLPVVEDKIFGDVVAYATNAESMSANRDRIKAVIAAFRPRLKEWRNKFARGEITREQYTTEIRNVWRQVRDQLEIPTNPASVPPHTPAPVTIPANSMGYHLGQFLQTAHPRPMMDTNGNPVGWTKGLHHGWLHSVAKHKFDHIT